MIPGMISGATEAVSNDAGLWYSRLMNLCIVTPCSKQQCGWKHTWDTDIICWQKVRHQTRQSFDSSAHFSSHCPTHLPYSISHVFPCRSFWNLGPLNYWNLGPLRSLSARFSGSIQLIAEIIHAKHR